MTPCGVTTGFFVLRRCGNPAVTGCAQCRRPLCQTHVADGGLCPECAAARGFRTHPAAGAAYHRRTFYGHTSHIYHDSSFYNSLDYYDRAPFDPDAAANAEYGSGEDSDDLVDS
jgi:hypothetical protein